MSARAVIALSIWSFGFAGCQSPALDLASLQLIDLSHAFDAETIYWPTEEGFVLERGSAGVTAAGYYYAANRFRSAEHGGTHLDAPVHFAEGGWTVDEIPLDRLVGAGIVIDVSDRCAANPDYQIREEDLLRWEAEHGEIRPGSIVLLRTGYSRYWPDRERYLGTKARGEAAVAQLHFPGLHPAAAGWLVESREVAAVGLDTPSIDFGQSKLFESHRTLFAANIPAFENLTNLAALPATGFQVLALPMKIRDGTGAPLRIVALVPQSRGD